jgi:hypothetical protein
MHVYDVHVVFIHTLKKVSKLERIIHRTIKKNDELNLIHELL